jgi:hypothetical protein
LFANQIPQVGVVDVVANANCQLPSECFYVRSCQTWTLTFFLWYKHVLSSWEKHFEKKKKKEKKGFKKFFFWGKANKKISL